MTDESDNKAATVGQAIADLVSDRTVGRRVVLQARGNVALQLGAYVTEKQLAAERARILAVDDDSNP